MATVTTGDIANTGIAITVTTTNSVAIITKAHVTAID
jgi:hypothetical protein